MNTCSATWFRQRQSFGLKKVCSHLLAYDYYLRMKRGRSRTGVFGLNIFLVLALTFCFAAPPIFAGTNDIKTLAELQQKISAFVSQPRFDGALWGIKVVSLDTGVMLYETNSERLMSPASNCKLYTGATALDHFGGDYRIATPIYATAKPNGRGTIHGDLIISGAAIPLGTHAVSARIFGTRWSRSWPRSPMPVCAA